MQAGDANSSKVYDLYYNKVFGYVLNRVRSRADAEDITSDVFLKLLSKPDEFDLNRAGASTYIFRVMQTTLADFYRRNRMYAPLEEAAETADAAQDQDALLALLDEALSALTEREQAVVILHYYHGLSHREIAQRMELSHVNVRQVCHVALKKLRKAME